MNRQQLDKRYYNVSEAYARESFGKIKLNLEFICIDNAYRCIMVTSSVAGEGKSTVTANIAVSLAASERKTLLVDTDLRHPTQHKLFDLVNKTGLSDILLKNLDWHEFVNSKATQNLGVITAGRMPPNPAELLGSNRMGELINEFKKEYELILFDTSPVLLVSDPISLLRHVDGIVVVARYKYTKIQDAVGTKNALHLANKPIIGTVLNHVSHTGSRYEYGYQKAGGSRYHIHMATEKAPAAGRQPTE